MFKLLNKFYNQFEKKLTLSTFQIITSSKNTNPKLKIV